MKPKNIAVVLLLVLIAGGTVWALLREVHREEERIRTSISGIVEVDRALFARGQADIVRTDRLALYLVDPETGKPVALKFISPMLPPQAYHIGQENALGGRILEGAYDVIGIMDKDGEIFKVTPGEVWGRSPEPVALGNEKFTFLLSEPFRGDFYNKGSKNAARAPMASAGGGAAGGDEGGDPAFSISGNIHVADALAERVVESDRLIVLLFDPEMNRPVAFKIIPHAILPQSFTIGLPQALQSAAKPGYFLRVVTDKDDNPFGSAEGELIGRSTEPIPLGTKALEFTLDQPYIR